MVSPYNFYRSLYQFTDKVKGYTRFYGGALYTASHKT